MIQIVVGGEAREIKENTTVAELLKIENVEMPEYISVSVNEELIARESFTSHILKNSDMVEFLYFMGGGAK